MSDQGIRLTNARSYRHPISTIELNNIYGLEYLKWFTPWPPITESFKKLRQYKSEDNRGRSCLMQSEVNLYDLIWTNNRSVSATRSSPIHTKELKSSDRYAKSWRFGSPSLLCLTDWYTRSLPTTSKVQTEVLRPVRLDRGLCKLESSICYRLRASCLSDRHRHMIKKQSGPLSTSLPHCDEANIVRAAHLNRLQDERFWSQ